jgi:hypothetical protein
MRLRRPWHTAGLRFRKSPTPPDAGARTARRARPPRSRGGWWVYGHGARGRAYGQDRGRSFGEDAWLALSPVSPATWTVELSRPGRSCGLGRAVPCRQHMPDGTGSVTRDRAPRGRRSGQEAGNPPRTGRAVRGPLATSGRLRSRRAWRRAGAAARQERRRRPRRAGSGLGVPRAPWTARSRQERRRRPRRPASGFGGASGHRDGQEAARTRQRALATRQAPARSGWDARHSGCSQPEHNARFYNLGPC